MINYHFHFSFSTRTSSATRYCFEHAPDSCTIVSIGKCGREQQYLDSNSPHSEGRLFKKAILGRNTNFFIRISYNVSLFAESHQSSLRWSNGNIHSDRAASPVQNPVFLDTKKENPSPRAVPDELGGESHSTEDDTCSSGDTSITESPPLASNFKSQSKTRKQFSPYRLIVSLFCSPLWKRNGSLSNKERLQPSFKCFSYEEIFNATNNFHPGKIADQHSFYNIEKGLKAFDGINCHSTSLNSISYGALTINSLNQELERNLNNYQSFVGIC